MPAGNVEDIPQVPKPHSQWNIGVPDLVVSMEDAIRIPASGPDKFVRVPIQLGLVQPQWIKAVEIRPGNRGVVHHAIAYVVQDTFIEPRWRRTLKEGGYLLSEYSAGNQRDIYPDGAGRFLDLSAHLVLEVHYLPNGQETLDRTQIAFKFHDNAEEVDHRVESLPLANFRLRIPAGDPNTSMLPKTCLMSRRSCCPFSRTCIFGVNPCGLKPGSRMGRMRRSRWFHAMTSTGKLHTPSSSHRYYPQARD